MPKGKPGFYICSQCRVEKPLSEFQARYTDPRDSRCPSLVKVNWCKDCTRAYMKVYSHRRRAERKFRVLVAYSGPIPKCACCGELEVRFLTVDHIERGGAKHRKSIGKGGDTFYTWLEESNFPPGFRILCYNCNCCTSQGGVCPHEEKRLAQAAD